jgi:hypothetical protein
VLFHVICYFMSYVIFMCHFMCHCPLDFSDHHSIKSVGRVSVSVRGRVWVNYVFLGLGQQLCCRAQGKNPQLWNIDNYNLHVNLKFLQKQLNYENFVKSDNFVIDMLIFVNACKGQLL